MKKGYKGELQKLVESRKYFKALLNEETGSLLNEQTGSCWLSSVVAAGGNSYVYSPGGTKFEMYCWWWFIVANSNNPSLPLVPNPGEWSPNNPYTNFNQPPFSTPGQPTGTGASNFIDCGCDLSGNTAPNWFTGTTTGTTTGSTTGTTGPVTCYGCDANNQFGGQPNITSVGNGIIGYGGGSTGVGFFCDPNTPCANTGVCGTWNGITMYSAQNNPSLAQCGGATTGSTSSTTGGTGTITCYGCQNGQIVTNSNTFFNSNMYGGTVCGTSSQGGVSTTWYGNQNDPALANCTGSPTGTTCDISYNTPCAQQHLTTGAQSSWDPWLALRQTGWDSVDCQHLQNVVNWTTDQLNSGVTGNGTALNPTQIARKTEKREWAQCQAAECGCATLNMPPLTGGPTPPPPSAPPKPGGGGPDNMEMKKPRVDKKEKKEKEDKKKLNEEFSRMKTLWKYKI